jgi:hypothetical protein
MKTILLSALFFSALMTLSNPAFAQVTISGPVAKELREIQRSNPSITSLNCWIQTFSSGSDITNCRLEATITDAQSQHPYYSGNKPSITISGPLANELVQAGYSLVPNGAKYIQCSQWEFTRMGDCRLTLEP